MATIKHALILVLCLCFYFTLHRLFLSHFKKRMDLEQIFTYSMSFIYLLTILCCIITCPIFTNFQDSVKLNIDIRITLPLFAFYNVLIQLLFIKSREIECFFSILSSSIISFIIIELILLFSLLFNQ